MPRCDTDSCSPLSVQKAIRAVTLSSRGPGGGLPAPLRAPQSPLECGGRTRRRRCPSVAWAAVGDMRRRRRLLMLVVGNVSVFAVLFGLREVGVQIYRDGVAETWSRFAHGEPVPYSNIGTGKWVIADPELGYRLNPEHDGINALSIRH